MNLFYFAAFLSAALALLAHRFAWAAAAGMAAAAVEVLAALVLNIPTQTLLLCLLLPCAVALLPKGGRP